jgi:hypothetical protein
MRLTMGQWRFEDEQAKIRKQGGLSYVLSNTGVVLIYSILGMAMFNIIHRDWSRQNILVEAAITIAGAMTIALVSAAAVLFHVISEKKSHDA